MSTTLKYTFFFLIAVLFGVSVYLGYQYFSESSGRGVGRGKNVVLKGQVLRADSAFSETTACPNQYYLVSGTRATWLIMPDGTETDWSVQFSKYDYLTVEVSGINRKENSCISIRATNCGCHDFLVVDDIKILENGSLSQREYTGQTTCVDELEEGASLDACRGGTGLFIPDSSDKIYGGKNYELRGDLGTGYREGGRVRVLGILTKNTSPLGLDGVLNVFEIEKLE